MDDDKHSDEAAQQVSALADGQLQGQAFAHALAQIDSDENARMHWHTYHLIGDVLRSDELARGAHGAARFLERLRERLAEETPPVSELAPEFTPELIAQPPELIRAGGQFPSKHTAQGAPAAANQPRFGWRRTAAGLAAGVAALAAAVWQFGGMPAAAPGAPAQALAQAQAQSSALPADGTAEVMLRDPQLDQLLAAHRQFSSASALPASAGFLRDATFQGTGR